MAYIVRRPAHRWEIRESVSTSDGPRSRTLAGFRTLTEDVIDRAVRAATIPVTADQLRTAAARAGAPVSELRVEAAARTLLAEIHAGRLPSEPLRRRLSASLSRPAIQPARRH